MAKQATATATKPKAADEQQFAQSEGQVPATQRAAHPLAQFQQYVAQRSEQLQFALPSHISPDRFTRVVLTALQRKPELLACTKQSLWNACLLAAQDGLMPDGREGAIVPYGENENGQKKADIATWMPMIEGLRKKARNSGEISNWEVHVVRARDHFRFALGDEAFIEHEPYFGAEEPGDVVGAYSIATLKDGTKSRDVMTLRDILKIKAKSKAKNGPWNDTTFFPEMCKKTVARRHYKQLPHSSDLDEMIKRDDQAFGLEDRGEEQIEVRQRRRMGSVAGALDTFAGPTIEHDDDAAGHGQDGAGTGDHDGGDAGQDAGGTAADGKGTGDLGAAGQNTGAKADAPATAPWPADKAPAKADEYAMYARTWINLSDDPDAWFKSKEQRDLRNACGVTKDHFDQIAGAVAHEVKRRAANAGA